MSASCAAARALVCCQLARPLIRCCSVGASRVLSFALAGRHADNNFSAEAGTALAPGLVSLTQLLMLNLDGGYIVGAAVRCSSPHARMLTTIVKYFSVLNGVLVAGNVFDVQGSDEAGVASAATCLAVLPCTVRGLHKMDASSAALVNTRWRKCHGARAQPMWLQALTGTAVTTTHELPPVLAAACSKPEYGFVLRQVVNDAPHLLQLQDADGCTALHHLLGSVVLQGRRGHASAVSTLSQHLQALLYAGVPLHHGKQAACKAARLAIQRHRADNPDQARGEEPYLTRVESLLEVLEKLQAAGTSLQFFTLEVDGTRQAVVSERATTVCC